MNNLVAILSRFRKEKIPLAADIESMYYQVPVSPHDRDSLRCLRWPGGNLEHQSAVYRTKVHLFGATSSRQGVVASDSRCVRQPSILALNLNLTSALLQKNIFMSTSF